MLYLQHLITQPKDDEPDEEEQLLDLGEHTEEFQEGGRSSKRPRRLEPEPTAGHSQEFFFGWRKKSYLRHLTTRPMDKEPNEKQQLLDLEKPTRELRAGKKSLKRLREESEENDLVVPQPPPLEVIDNDKVIQYVPKSAETIRPSQLPDQGVDTVIGKDVASKLVPALEKVPFVEIGLTESGKIIVSEIFSYNVLDWIKRHGLTSNNTIPIVTSEDTQEPANCKAEEKGKQEDKEDNSGLVSVGPDAMSNKVDIKDHIEAAVLRMFELQLRKRINAIDKTILEEKKRRVEEMKAEIDSIKKEQQKYVHSVCLELKNIELLKARLEVETCRRRELAEEEEEAWKIAELTKIKKYQEYMIEKGKELERTKAMYTSRPCGIKYFEVQKQCVEAENNFKALQKQLRDLEQKLFKLMCLIQSTAKKMREPGITSEMTEIGSKTHEDDEEKLHDEKDSTEQPTLINNLNNIATATMPNKLPLVTEQIMELDIPRFNNVTTHEFSPFTSDISKQKITKKLAILKEFPQFEFPFSIAEQRNKGIRMLSPSDCSETCSNEMGIEMPEDVSMKLLDSSHIENSVKQQSAEGTKTTNKDSRRISDCDIVNNTKATIQSSCVSMIRKLSHPDCSGTCSNEMGIEMPEDVSMKSLGSSHIENSIKQQSAEGTKTTDRDSRQISDNDIVNNAKATIQSNNATRKHFETEENLKEQLEKRRFMKQLSELYRPWIRSQMTESKKTQQLQQKGMQETTVARSSLNSQQIDEVMTDVRLHEDIKKPMSVKDLNTINTIMSNNISSVNEQIMNHNIPTQSITAIVSEQEVTENMCTGLESVIHSAPQSFQSVNSSRECLNTSFSSMPPFFVTEQQSTRMNPVLSQNYGEMSCIAMEIEKSKDKPTKLRSITLNADNSAGKDFSTGFIHSDTTVTPKGVPQEQDLCRASATVLNSMIQSGRSIPNFNEKLGTSLLTFSEEPREPSHFFINDYFSTNSAGKTQKHGKHLHENIPENIVIPNENIEPDTFHQITCSTILGENKKPAEGRAQTIAESSKEIGNFAERNRTFLSGSNTDSISATPQLLKDSNNPAIYVDVPSAERPDCITSVEESFRKMSIDDFLNLTEQLRNSEIAVSIVINLQNRKSDGAVQIEVKNATELKNEERGSADVKCCFPKISPVSFPTASGSPNNSQRI